MVELFDKLDRDAIGPAEFKLDRRACTENCRVSKPVKLVYRAGSVSYDPAAANACPTAGKALLHFVKDAIREGCTVCKVGVVVLAKVVTKTPKSKADSIINSAGNPAKIGLNEPVENFINLFLR